MNKFFKNGRPSSFIVPPMGEDSSFSEEKIKKIVEEQVLRILQGNNTVIKQLEKRFLHEISPKIESKMISQIMGVLSGKGMMSATRSSYGHNNVFGNMGTFIGYGLRQVISRISHLFHR